MNFDNLVAVLAVAAAVPLILAAVPWVPVPGPVLEIVAGIVLGPAVLDLVKPDQAVGLVSTIGLASCFSCWSGDRRPPLSRASRPPGRTSARSERAARCECRYRASRSRCRRKPAARWDHSHRHVAGPDHLPSLMFEGSKASSDMALDSPGR
jgi:hypothetical protein